jgi:hypothetical protein
MSCGCARRSHVRRRRKSVTIYRQSWSNRGYCIASTVLSASASSGVSIVSGSVCRRSSLHITVVFVSGCQQPCIRRRRPSGPTTTTSAHDDMSASRISFACGSKRAPGRVSWTKAPGRPSARISRKQSSPDCSGRHASGQSLLASQAQRNREQSAGRARYMPQPVGNKCGHATPATFGRGPTSPAGIGRCVQHSVQAPHDRSSMTDNRTVRRPLTSLENPPT